MLIQQLNGIIVIDKPGGYSSAQVVARVKKLFGAAKAGHTGTLDPFARGVLVCCINQATKLAGFLLQGSKKYRATLRLGVDTDTQDLTGQIVSTSNNVSFSEDSLCSVFKQYEGPYNQLPPVFSALKHKGEPLYKLARRGKPLQKPPRAVHIYNIDILEIDIPEIRFDVSCSTGTYIRTLCADIGKSLGCGGHLSALKRTECGGFGIEQAVSLLELEQIASDNRLADSLVGMTDALPDMPKVAAGQTLAKKIKHGQSIAVDDLGLDSNQFFDTKDKNFVKIVDTRNALLAIMQYERATPKLRYCSVFQSQ